jgi:hypothetical protein
MKFIILAVLVLYSQACCKPPLSPPKKCAECTLVVRKCVVDTLFTLYGVPFTDTIHTNEASFTDFTACGKDLDSTLAFKPHYVRECATNTLEWWYIIIKANYPPG